MFDFNQFKRAVKNWMDENPQATTQDLREFCEDQIPSQFYTSHSWVVEQTVAWFTHIITSRAALSVVGCDYEEDVA